MRRRSVIVLVLTVLAVVVVGVLIGANSGDPLADLADYATILGPITVIGSVAFIIRQIEEASNTNRAQLFDATAGRIFDLNRIFIDAPELRPYFYDGRDIEGLDSLLRDKVEAVAEIHIEFFDTELLRQRQFTKTLEGMPDFDGWIRGVLRTSPAVCRRLAADAALGEKGWYDAIVGEYRRALAAGDVAWPVN